MKGDTQPAILLFRGRGLVSSVIRWQTRSVYSHAALRMRDGGIVESWQGDGVRVKRLPDTFGVDAFDVKGARPVDWDNAIAFALSHVGARYDYAGVIRFITRTKVPWQNDRWFCSELVHASFARFGIELLARVQSENVSPAMLGFSPLLVPIPGLP